MMAPAPRLDRDSSQLLVVDVQEKLAPHVAGHEALIARCAALVAAADGLQVPKLLTEHCPAQIGAVVPRLRERFAPGDVFVKTHFAATDHEAFCARLRPGRRQVVVAGMEAHVCVMQTVLGLRRIGLAVVVVADAVGSRPARQTDRDLALRRMEQAGCSLAGTETVLFEWTASGVDPHFRSVLSTVKAL